MGLDLTVTRNIVMFERNWGNKQTELGNLSELPATGEAAKIDKYTERQTDRQRQRQKKHRQRERERDTHTHTHTHTYRDRERHTHHVHIKRAHTHTHTHTTKG